MITLRFENSPNGSRGHDGGPPWIRHYWGSNGASSYRMQAINGSGWQASGFIAPVKIRTIGTRILRWNDWFMSDRLNPARFPGMDGKKKNIRYVYWYYVIYIHAYCSLAKPPWQTIPFFGSLASIRSRNWKSVREHKRFYSRTSKNGQFRTLVPAPITWN